MARRAKNRKSLHKGKETPEQAAKRLAMTHRELLSEMTKDANTRVRVVPDKTKKYRRKGRRKGDWS
jgi:hypothetical protein